MQFKLQEVMGLISIMDEFLYTMPKATLPINGILEFRWM